jgi:hypothetical protein
MPPLPVARAGNSELGSRARAASSCEASASRRTNHRQNQRQQPDSSARTAATLYPRRAAACSSPPAPARGCTLAHAQDTAATAIPGKTRLAVTRRQITGRYRTGRRRLSASNSRAAHLTRLYAMVHSRLSGKEGIKRDVRYPGCFYDVNWPCHQRNGPHIHCNAGSACTTTAAGQLSHCG